MGKNKGIWALLIGAVVLMAIWSLNQGGQERVADGVTLEGRDVGGWDNGQVTELVAELAQATEREPRDAFIDPETGEITPDEPGFAVDREATVQRVFAAQTGEEVALVTNELPAQVTEESLVAETGGALVLVGGGRTEVIDDQAGRVRNLEVATNLISNYRLGAGEEFSFNGVVGTPTEAKGFQEAPIIGDDGQFTQGVGGGICQVSSTLFQAAQMAGLEIVERHGHSQPVKYTPPGTDATVVPGEKDLRFRNNRERELLILGSADAQEVQFVILEHREQ